ncbi:MAG: hypothetical protein HFJ65_02175 [Eggerthellaceae bacterium]|nr:hypothetical protein [Eggerthellaceae bacterium]
MDQERIDVEKLLQEVRSEIEERYTPEDIKRFELVANDESFIRLSCENSYNDSVCTERIIHCLEGQTVKVEREMKGSFPARFVKKLARKLSRPFIVPIVEDQNSFNSDVTIVLYQLLSRLDEQERVISELRDQVESKG